MAQKVSNFIRSMLKSIFFDDQRKYFSRTAFMNFCFFFLSAFTWIVLIVILINNYMKEGKVDSTFVGVITGYATFITGGGFLQYSYGKVISGRNGKGAQEQEVQEQKAQSSE